MGQSTAVSACVAADCELQELNKGPFIHRRCILPLEYQPSLLIDGSEMEFIFWSEPNFQCAAACCGMLQNSHQQATKSGAAACRGMLQPLVPAEVSQPNAPFMGGRNGAFLWGNASKKVSAMQAFPHHAIVWVTWQPTPNGVC